MNAIVPKSKNKPVKSVSNKSKIEKETSDRCQINSIIRSSCDVIKNQVIKYNSRENLPLNLIFCKKIDINLDLKLVFIFE
jgi:hypothetical protein